MPRPRLFSVAELSGLVLLALAAFLIGLRGIFNYGYIGQDFEPHHFGIVHFPESFGYNLTDPPGFYWLGSWIRDHLSTGHYLELTALAFLILNTAALALIYRFIWQSLAQGPLRWAAAALITFLPVRVIHGIVIAADALTLPIFVLAAWFAIQLHENPRRTPAWIGLSITLSLGMLSKYTFVGLLPPLVLVLANAIVQGIPVGKRRRWWVIGAAALALPAAILGYEVCESAAVKGAITNDQWLRPGEPAVMRWRDMLAPQASDFDLFSAPPYFDGALYDLRRYSYPGLVFISTFTDPLNLFQPPPQEISRRWDQRWHEAFFRQRSDRAQILESCALRWSFPLFLLAIAGTLCCGALGLQSLLTKTSHLPKPAVAITALAAGYYSPVFIGLHRIANPYGEGFWMARLILPALVVFFILGFVLLDLLVQGWTRTPVLKRMFLSTVAGWTAITCLFYVGFLV